jgi:hypothetical protein
MKTGKKLLVMIIAVTLAGAAVPGGIIFQNSQKTIEGPGAKELIQQAEKKAGSMGRRSAGLRPPARNIPRRISRAPAYRLLTAGAVTGGLMLAFATAAAFIMARREAGHEEPEPDRPENAACDIKQITTDIGNINSEIERQLKSISQSALAIKQMLAGIQSIAKTLKRGGGGTLLNGTQGEALDHITLTK